MRVGRTVRLSASEYSSQQQCNRFFLGVVAVILLGIIPYSLYVPQVTLSNVNTALENIAPHIHEIPAGMSPPFDTFGIDSVVHVAGLSPVRPSVALVDSDFGLSHPSALKLRRRVEYCQWTETRHNSSQVRNRRGGENYLRYSQRQDSYQQDQEQRYVTYSYTKKWRPRPIPSIFFDQPAAHHNPMRDPVPPREWAAPEALAGVYSLAPELIAKMDEFVPVSWGRGHLEAPFNRSEVLSSPAATEHKFRYIGNGYFYSAYLPQGAEQVARTTGMWLEGSLLDYQLGDLFHACTAGDIRVWYEAVAPETVSVLGRLTNTTIGKATAANGYRIGMVQQGVRTASQMMDVEISRAWWSAVFWHACAVGWGAILGGWLEQQQQESVAFSWVRVTQHTLAFAGFLCTTVWLVVYGPSPWTVSMLCVCSVVVYSALSAWYKNLASCIQQADIHNQEQEEQNQANLPPRERNSQEERNHAMHSPCIS